VSGATRLFKAPTALFLGPGGTGKSHLAQVIEQAAILQGYRVVYRETHVLLNDLADAVADRTREEFMGHSPPCPCSSLTTSHAQGTVDCSRRSAGDHRRYERVSTLLTSNRPVEDWGKLLSDVAAVSSMLDRMLHHGHVLKCGPRSWRTKAASAGDQ
jgi:DNA replication protein DnaC